MHNNNNNNKYVFNKLVSVKYIHRLLGEDDRKYDQRGDCTAVCTLPQRMSFWLFL
jgi:hypothetical protein